MMSDDVIFRELISKFRARLGIGPNHQPYVTRYDVSFEHIASKYNLAVSVRVRAESVMHGWEIHTIAGMPYHGGLPVIRDVYFVPHMPKINALLNAIPNQEHKLWNWRHTDEDGIESQILTDDEIAVILQRIKGQIHQ